jgi:hypothetical protein
MIMHWCSCHSGSVQQQQRDAQRITALLEDKADDDVKSAIVYEMHLKMYNYTAFYDMDTASSNR